MNDISPTLLAQLGGGLTIESTPGRGTTIQLWFPISAETIVASEPFSAELPALDFAGLALLVDDEELVRISTTEMLVDLGYEVTEVSSAEDALRLVRKGLRPDLLITADAGQMAGIYAIRSPYPEHTPQR